MLQMGFFVKKPRKPPVSISFEFRMTASSPNSARMTFIASCIVFALYFFTFILHSPLLHFALQHLLQARYKTRLEHVVNNVQVTVLHTSEQLENIG